MSKRQSKPSDLNFNFKKPKLDSESSYSLPSTHNAVIMSSRLDSFVENDDDLWGEDDDDEILLLLSQACEEREEQSAGLREAVTKMAENKAPLSCSQRTVINAHPPYKGDHSFNKLGGINKQGYANVQGNSNVNKLTVKNLANNSYSNMNKNSVKEKGKSTNTTAHPSKNTVNTKCDAFDDYDDDLSAMLGDNFEEEEQRDNASTPAVKNPMRVNSNGVPTPFGESIHQNKSFNVSNNVASCSKYNSGDVFKKPNIVNGTHKNVNETLRLGNNECVGNVGGSLKAGNEDVRLDHLLKQVRGFKSENEKLKSQIGLLSDKGLTKDGEVSILRMQLKNSQAQVDAARMEKVKYQERKEFEYNRKLLAAQNELENFKAQMEFKNLEVAKMKEKCRLLETSKIKLVEPLHNAAALDNTSKWPSFSQKMNCSKLDTTYTKPQMCSKEVMVELGGYEDVKILPSKLNKYPVLESVPDSVFELCSTPELAPTLGTDLVPSSTTERYGMFSVRRNDAPKKAVIESGVMMHSIHADLSKLMKMTGNELRCNKDAEEHALRITLTAKGFLLKMLQDLKVLATQVTPVILKEMDILYLQSSQHAGALMLHNDPFQASAWYDGELCISTRRTLAVVSRLCLHIPSLAKFLLNEESSKCSLAGLKERLPSCSQQKDEGKQSVIGIIMEICENIGNIGCSHFYTGVLCVICRLLHSICTSLAHDLSPVYPVLTSLLRALLSLRPRAPVLVPLISVLAKMAADRRFLETVCGRRVQCNIQLDFSQGLDHYNNETCLLQLFCGQAEVMAMSCHEAGQAEGVFSLTADFVVICYDSRRCEAAWTVFNEESRCQCYERMHQCLSACLSQAFTLYKNHNRYFKEHLRRRYACVLRAGILLLSLCLLKDLDFTYRLLQHEGHYQLLVQGCGELAQELGLEEMHKEALEYLVASIAANCEDPEQSEENASPIWNQCFENFTLD